MFELIKKDSLILSRSRSDLTELLFMPFILIAILGLALGNLTMTEFNINAFPVAVVHEQTTAESLNNWESELEERGVPSEGVRALVAQAEDVAPGEQVDYLFNSEEIQEWMTVEEYSSAEAAQAALDDGDISGVIIIPEGFNEAVWSALFLEEEGTHALTLEVQNVESVTTDILRSVLTTYANQFNLEASIAIATEGEADTANQQEESYGEVTNLTAADPITSFQYYTIGMGAMFALHTAPALASRAFLEKKQHVFGRLMISGTKPLTYLGSKLVSGTLITFIQLGILFGLSTLIFGTFRGYALNFWIDLSIVSFAFSLVVGSITSLLTSISLYSDSNTSSSFFGGIIVTLFAFIGGSFTPVEQFSESLRALGNWTPNGAMMTSYLQLMQGFSLTEVAPLIIRVIGMTAVLLVTSVVLFPKRRLD
ncbi:MAG: ABC transporter permease [Alkalibacterium sp.]|nr:ABC transporter permease [Alkalibacterium sp.]